MAEKTGLIHMHGGAIGPAKINLRTPVKLRTVRNVIINWNWTGLVVSKARLGRPIANSPCQDRKIIFTGKGNRFVKVSGVIKICVVINLISHCSGNESRVPQLHLTI